MDEYDTSSNLSSLADVPPYLKDQYTPLGEVFHAHASTLPSKKPAESNSDAVIRSLKALQDKIKSLEVERVATADKFQSLSHNAKTVPGLVGASTQRTHSDMTTTPLSMDRGSDANQGLKSRLDTLDERLTQQSLELDTMQRKLRLADTYTVHAPLTSPSVSPRQVECRCSLTEEKLKTLEQGVTHLREAQSKTKKKVDVLETCMDGNTMAEDGTQSTMAYFDAGGQQGYQKLPCTLSTEKKCNHCMPKTKKRKGGRQTRVQSAPVPRGDGTHCVPRPIPGIHYRLDMKDVPFIVGSSTAPSHSVSANYQQVLSLMKSHNHVLCGAAALNGKRKTNNERPRQTKSERISLRDLEVLLAGLEEEFGALTFEHQALAHHLKNDPASQKPRIKASLEMQLKHLEDQLESKSEQIQIVSKQMTAQNTKKRKPKKTESKVFSTMKECEQLADKRAQSPVGARKQLCFLKKMKVLQSTLQSEDLNWK